jgi:ligand-binding sensor domain-containing protein
MLNFRTLLLLLVCCFTKPAFSQFTNYYVPQHVHSIVAKDSLLYCANEKEIAVVNANNGSFTTINYPHLVTPYCQVSVQIALDTANEIWMTGAAFGDSLFHYNGSSWNSFYVQLAYASNIAIAPDGIIFLDDYLSHKMKFNGSTFTPIGNYTGQMAFDTSGNAWTATLNGLYKYDGSVNTLFNPSNSCLPDSMTAIHIDAQQNIWIGAFSEYPPIGIDSAFLVKYDGSTCAVYNVSNSNFPVNATRILGIRDDGTNIWFSTREGFVKFDGVNFTEYNMLNSNLPGYTIIQSLAIDHNGNPWIGKEDFGLLKFGGTSFSENPLSNVGLSGNHIRALAVDNHQRVWISNSEFNDPTIQPGGLSAYDGTWWQFDAEFHSSAIPFLPDVYPPTGYGIGTGDSVWMTNNDTLFLYENGVWQAITNNTGSCVIYNKHIAVDQNNNVWIASPGGGLYKWDGSTIAHITNPIGFAAYNIAIGPDNILWVTTANKLYRYDGVNWTFYDYTNSPLNSLHWAGLAVDKDSTVWIANNSIYRLKDTTWTVFDFNNYPIPDGANCVTVDANNNKWFGAYDYSWAGHGGIVKLDDTTWTHFNSFNSNLQCNDVISIATDNVNGKVWVGTMCGLAVMQDSSIIATPDGITENFQMISGVKAYPNPASVSTTVFFQLLHSSQVSISLIDLMGRTISSVSKKYSAGRNMETISIEELSAGIYFCRIEVKGEVSVVKIVKQ